MSERFTFPIADIRRAKQRAAAAARIDRDVAPVAGTIDPTPVLESFGCLRVKREWKLLACLMGDHLGSESRVVAVPAGFDPATGMATREPVVARPKGMDEPYAEYVWDEGLLLPPVAVRRFMTAIEGDGTPWSYLCASLAVRQFLDFAAFWHALYQHDWHEHIILAAWPPPRSLLKEPSWGFEGRAPLSWRPEVVVARDHVIVRIHTYRAPFANSEGVFLNEDRYALGSYDPVMKRIVEAEGRPATIRF
jgi:hypothetical protein